MKLVKNVKTKDLTVIEIYDSLNEKQKELFNYLIGYSLEGGKITQFGRSRLVDKDTYNSFNKEQKKVLHYLVSEAEKEYEEKKKGERRKKK